MRALTEELTVVNEPQTMPFVRSVTWVRYLRSCPPPRHGDIGMTESVQSSFRRTPPTCVSLWSMSMQSLMW